DVPSPSSTLQSRQRRRVSPTLRTQVIHRAAESTRLTQRQGAARTVSYSGLQEGSPWLLRLGEECRWWQVRLESRRLPEHLDRPGCAQSDPSPARGCYRRRLGLTRLSARRDLIDQPAAATPETWAARLLARGPSECSSTQEVATLTVLILVFEAWGVRSFLRHEGMIMRLSYPRSLTRPQPVLRFRVCPLASTAASPRD